MSLRALRAGVGVLLLAVALGLIGARPAAAVGEGFWMQGWQWLVSVWAKTGPEIDPDGQYKPPQPPGSGLITVPQTTPEISPTADQAPAIRSSVRAPRGVSSTARSSAR